MNLKNRGFTVTGEEEAALQTEQNHPGTPEFSLGASNWTMPVHFGLSVWLRRVVAQRMDACYIPCWLSYGPGCRKLTEELVLKIVLLHPCLTQRTWICANSGRSGRTGNPGVLQAVVMPQHSIGITANNIFKILIHMSVCILYNVTVWKINFQE